MKKLRVAVVGAGYLGKFHAQKYAAMDHVDLVGIVDMDKATADQVAGSLHTKSHCRHQDLFGQVDAVSIATSTPAHFHVSRDFLNHGTHLLIEKPITTTMDEAKELMALSRAMGLIIQVGHIERFNPVTVALKKITENPFLFEANRLSPFKTRGSDVSVILDLMIHDIDIVLNLADSPVKHIHGSGACVATDLIDIAWARIEFENGCVANLSASRIAEEASRQMKMFQKNGYMDVDFGIRKMSVFRPPSFGSAQETEKPANEIVFGMEKQTVSFESGDALDAELRSFVDAVSSGKPPEVTGQMGCDALDTALKITDCIHAGR